MLNGSQTQMKIQTLLCINCQPSVIRRAALDSLRDISSGHRRHRDQEEEPSNENENNDEGGFILEPVPQPAPERQGNNNNNESQQIIKKAKKPRSEDMEIQRNRNSVSY